MATDEFVSRRRFAELLGVNVRQIADYRKHPDFPVRVRGRTVEIPLARGLRWWVDFKVSEQLRRKGQTPTAPGEKPLTPSQRKDLADAKKKELEYELALERLVPAEVALREVATYQERIRAIVLAMPGRYADERLVQVPTLGRVLRELKRIAAGLMTDLQGDAEELDPAADADAATAAMAE